MSSSDKPAELKAFISYSRKDGLAFVDQLVAALQVINIQAMIDRDSISGGENWRERLQGLIAESDTVIFVLTPASVSSEICAWETAQSDALGKRILPVVPAPLAETLLPEPLNRLNHIFFYPNNSLPGSGFGKGLADLSAALRTDLNWVRAHTRYGQRAAEWLAGNRVHNRLLSGNDIAVAKTWITERQANAPEITDNMREFIKASEQADLRRKNLEQKRLKEKEETLSKIEAAQKERAQAQKRAQRFLLGGVLLSGILALLAAFMWLQASKAEQQAKGLLDLVAWVGNQDLEGKRTATEAQKHSMIALCHKAIEITKSIASQKNTENKPRQTDIDGFWKLYTGALYVIEQYERHHSPTNKSAIESGMVNFGKILQGKREGSLSEAANRVENACGDFEQSLTSTRLILP